MRNRGAFTLVEMLIVITIIVILATIAYTALLSSGIRGKIERTKALMLKVRGGAHQFKSEWGDYPYVFETNSFHLWKRSDSNRWSVDWGTRHTPICDDASERRLNDGWLVSNDLYSRLAVAKPDIHRDDFKVDPRVDPQTIPEPQRSVVVAAARLTWNNRLNRCGDYLEGEIPAQNFYWVEDDRYPGEKRGVICDDFVQKPAPDAAIPGLATDAADLYTEEKAIRDSEGKGTPLIYVYRTEQYARHDATGRKTNGMWHRPYARELLNLGEHVTRVDYFHPAQFRRAPGGAWDQPGFNLKFGRRHNAAGFTVGCAWRSYSKISENTTNHPEIFSVWPDPGDRWVTDYIRGRRSLFGMTITEMGRPRGTTVISGLRGAGDETGRVSSGALGRVGDEFEIYSLGPDGKGYCVEPSLPTIAVDDPEAVGVCFVNSEHPVWSYSPEDTEPMLETLAPDQDNISVDPSFNAEGATTVSE